MGRYKVIIRLLIACCICGVVLSIGDFKHPSARQLRRDRLLPFQLTDVSEVSLTLANGNEVVLESSPSGWNMTSPSQSRAQDSTVLRLLDAVEQAPLLETIDLEEKELRNLTTADFGFDNPVGRMSIGGPRFRAQLIIGYCDAVSNSLFVSRHLNQVNEQDQAVYVTTPALREFFLMTPGDYMDRRVFQCNMSMVHTVILRRPALGDVKLVRDEINKRQWNIVQPFSARADWDVVGRLFNILSATTFVDNFQNGSKILTSGVDQSESPSITLLSKNDLTGQTLVLGDRVQGDADLTYARSPAGVLTVTGAVRRAVLAPAYDFRDRRLFPAAESLEVQSLSIDLSDPNSSHLLALRRAGSGWAVTAPVSATAEPGDVAALLEALLSLRAERFIPFDEQTAGKNMASATIVLGRDRKPFSFSVYSPENAGDGQLGILADGLDALYLVPDKIFYTNVLTYCKDPRQLISRTVLAINEEHVRAVTISGPGTTTQRLEKVIGEWKSSTPGRQIDEASVRRFFASAASVRAESVAALAPTDALPLAGGAEISFDMDDGASLRRILTIGPRQADGHPAAVKGNDTVFILSPETVSGLTRPLFVPEEPAAVETPSNPPVTDKDLK